MQSPAGPRFTGIAALLTCIRFKRKRIACTAIMTRQRSTKFLLLIALAVFVTCGTILFHLSTTWQKGIHRLSAFAVLFPVVVGWAIIDKLDRRTKLILALVTASLAVETASLTLGIFQITNLWAFSFYTVVEYVLLTSFFYLSTSRPAAQRIIGGSIPFFVGVWLYSLIKMMIDSDLDFDFLVVTLECLLLLGFAFISLIELTKENIEDIFVMPGFWVGLAVLIYFAGNLALFAILSKVESVSWIIHTVNNILLYLSYTVAFLCQNRLPRPR
jgi:hypothetical protein